MGEDTEGKYFLFFNNASGLVPYENYGANPENKLYYEASTGEISGTSNTDYYDNAEYDYLVTQIRKSKSL